jgi:hypothetical protein
MVLKLERDDAIARIADAAVKSHRSRTKAGQLRRESSNAKSFSLRGSAMVAERLRGALVARPGNCYGRPETSARRCSRCGKQSTSFRSSHRVDPMRNRSLLLPVKLSSIALGAGLVLAGVSASSVASAQAFPFPSTNVQPGNGKFVTSVLTSHELRAKYDEWRSEVIRACPGRGSRMIYPETNGVTASEGIGYGMVIAAYMGDQATFDGLWTFYQSHSNQGLMDWLINDCNQVGDGGSAADADIDAAFGLIVADRQWGGYAGDAAGILQQVRTRLFNNGCSGILLAGSNFANCGCVNPSYIPPGYYRAFGEYDDATFWNGARNSTYTYLAATQLDATGLVPAWSNSGGGTNLTNCNPQVSGGGQPSEFQADAARTPWRVAADWLWTGEPRAGAFLTPMARFAASAPNRITNIVDRYQLTGAPLPGPNGGNNPLNAATIDADTRRSTFTMGGFATAMTASSQDNIDQFTGAWRGLYAPGDTVAGYRAFNNSLAILYGILVTGFMWDPVGTDPTPVVEPALQEQPGSILTNGDFDEGVLGWNTENLGGVLAEGFSVHENGEVHVLLQKVTGLPNDQYMVRMKQQVTLQAGQNYRLSLRARAAEPRLLRVFVGQRDVPYMTYLQMDDDAETEGDGIRLTTDMQTFSVVQTAPASSGFVQLALDFADSNAEVVIDDISLTPTSDPVTDPGAPVVVPPAGDPGTPPATPGTPGTPGTPPTTDGTIGTVTPGGENTGTPGNPAAGPSNPIDATAGMPPAPGLAPASNVCSAANPNVCAPFMCSVELGLCYDPNTGYVRDPSTNDWALPPTGYPGCSPGQVFWPKFGGVCYEPESGYIWNNDDDEWQFYGVDFTEGKEREAADSTCDVSGVPGGRAGTGWMLVGLLGAALGLSYRRRAA